MKKNYIQPESEFIVLGSSTDIAVDLNSTSTRDSMEIDSHKKDLDDNLDWEEDWDGVEE